MISRPASRFGEDRLFFCHKNRPICFRCHTPAQLLIGESPIPTEHGILVIRVACSVSGDKFLSRLCTSLCQFRRTGHGLPALGRLNVMLFTEGVWQEVIVLLEDTGIHSCLLGGRCERVAKATVEYLPQKVPPLLPHFLCGFVSPASLDGEKKLRTFPPGLQIRESSVCRFPLHTLLCEYA